MIHLVPIQGEVTIRVRSVLVLTSWLVYSSCIEHKVALLHVLEVCMAFYFCQVNTGYVLIILLLLLLSQ